MRKAEQQTNYIVVGQMGSGKDEIGIYLRERYGYMISKLGDPIRNDSDKLIRLLGLEGDPRDYYQSYGQGMRSMFSPVVWCGLLSNRMENNFARKGPYVIADCRQMEEIEYWTAKGFVPIALHASEKIRKERLKVRDGQDQEKYFHHETEVFAGEIIEKIKYGEIPGHYLTNEGTLEELYEAIEHATKEGRVAHG